MEKNPFFILFACLILGLCVSACDKAHTKDYYVQNDSDAEVLLTFKVGETQDSMPIGSMQKELIYTQEYFFGTVGVDDDRYDDLVSDLVVKWDSSQKILEEKLWEYEELDKYHARYLMKID